MSEDTARRRAHAPQAGEFACQCGEKAHVCTTIDHSCALSQMKPAKGLLSILEPALVERTNHFLAGGMPKPTQMGRKPPRID
jgi:hypothetical protein